jgi:Family of unknown function (DUF695)
MNAPRPDGLSSNEEFQILNTIEDALTERLEKDCDACLAGRITGDGRREFYYYGRTPSNLRLLVDQELASAFLDIAPTLIRNLILTGDGISTFFIRLKRTTNVSKTWRSWRLLETLETTLRLSDLFGTMFFLTPRTGVSDSLSGPKITAFNIPREFDPTVLVN